MRGTLHRQITDDLRARITGGEYPPGERLPTEPELEQMYGASRNTIRMAVSTLVHEGLIHLQAGRGMFVPDGPIPFIVLLSKEEGGDGMASGLDSYSAGVQAAGRRPRIEAFKMHIDYPAREIAGWLEIDEDTQVAVRSSKRYIDDRPHSLQSSYYSMHLVRDSEIAGKNGIARGAIKVLEELGHPQAGYRDEIVARMPTPEESRFFKIGPGVPVIVVHRVAYAADGLPIRLTVTTYAADRNRPCYELGKVPERHLAEGQISTVG